MVHQLPFGRNWLTMGKGPETGLLYEWGIFLQLFVKARFYE